MNTEPKDKTSKNDRERQDVRRTVEINRVRKGQTVTGADGDDLEEAVRIDVDIEVEENHGTIIGFSF